MPIVTLQTEDGESRQVEVSLSDIKPKEDEDIVVQSQEDYDSNVQSRLNRQERKLKDDLQKSDDFFRTAAEKRGLELDDNLRPKGHVKDEDFRKYKQKASKVDELQGKVESYQQQIAKTRQTQLENLVHKTDASMQPGAAEDVMTNVKALMTYDEELGWVKQDEDGIAYAGGEPVGVGKVVEEVRKAKPFLFRDKSAANGPTDDPTSTGEKKTYTEDEWRSMRGSFSSRHSEAYKDWSTAPDEGRIT